jgi:hypothetical protein
VLDRASGLRGARPAGEADRRRRRGYAGFHNQREGRRCIEGTRDRGARARRARPARRCRCSGVKPATENLRRTARLFGRAAFRVAPDAPSVQAEKMTVR